MPKVKNWQLGREMEYRYDEAHPEWQFVAVFNTNRCIACQTCTMACKSTWTFSRGQEYMWWNNVETKPYGGYPKYWDVKLLEKMDAADPGGQKWDRSKADDKHPYGVYEGKTVFELAPKDRYALGYQPTDDEWQVPNFYEDTPVGAKGAENKFPKQGGGITDHATWFFYLARICNHCTYPACLAACPRQAPYKRPEDGIVLIDQQRCWGYRRCVEACPYKKAMYRPETKTSEKCIGCYPRIEGLDPMAEGVPMETRCMSVCVGKIRLQGLVKIDGNGEWADDPTNPLYYMVREEKVGLPLYPQFGTEPNIYYIPPRWVPRPYLHQMFGPGVDHAIDAYTMPSRKLLAVLQLFRATRKIIFRFEVIEGKKVGEANVNGKTLELFDDTVVGYDKNDKEAIRISVMEPTFERDAKYLNSI